MEYSQLVDVIVGLVLLFSCWLGWRQGLIISLTSLLGVVIGLGAGLWLAPQAMAISELSALRFPLGLGTLVLCVAMGNMLGGWFGELLREQLHRLALPRLADCALGAAIQTIVAALVVWLVAVPLAVTPGFADTMKKSQLLKALDAAIPAAADALPTKMSAMLTDTGLPPLFSPFLQASGQEVDAPTEIIDQALVDRLRPSIVQVIGSAPNCSRRLSGTGFVIAPGVYVTNAHVVAGTRSVTVQTTAGSVDAAVVLFNPSEDIAVLRGKDLGLPALQFADTEARHGDEALVLGFPDAGPFTATNVRIRQTLRVDGPDIYATSRLIRTAYTVRGTIRHGNSGGPMVAPTGQVLGLVFGADSATAETGYALVASEVQQVIGEVSSLTEPVSTQKCVGT